MRNNAGRFRVQGWGLRAKANTRSTGTYPEPRTPNPEPRAFTLVELLVVIAILGILVSLVTAGAQAARRRGAITKAKTTIAALETAIAMYEGDMGLYPETGNEQFVSALQDDPEDPDWNGPYIESSQFNDAWGNAICYCSSSTCTACGTPIDVTSRIFTLTSGGPDGNPATTADNVGLTVNF